MSGGLWRTECAPKSTPGKSERGMPPFSGSPKFTFAPLCTLAEEAADCGGDECDSGGDEREGADGQKILSRTTPAAST